MHKDFLEKAKTMKQNSHLDSFIHDNVHRSGRWEDGCGFAVEQT